MPRKSIRAVFTDYVVWNALENIASLECDADEDDEAIDEILDDALEAVLLVQVCRQVVDRPSTEPNAVRGDVLAKWDDHYFMQMLNVNRRQFARLISLISEDYEFRKGHAHKQFSLELQMAIVLYRLGACGDNANIRKIASVFDVSDGGAVPNITQRMFRAISRLQNKYVFWPNKQERKQIIAKTIDELPYCIGYVGTMEIKLADTPSQDPTVYCSHNLGFSMKAQVVCDYRLRVRHFAVGHGGSVDDESIYESCGLFTRKQHYFSSLEWIAGDLMFPSSDTLKTPYSGDSQHLVKKDKSFTKRLNNYRTRIDECMKRLKERFRSLTDLRVRIRNDVSRDLCRDWFRVCCIIHNFLIADEEEFGVCSNNTTPTSTDDERVTSESA